jgi:hypothetical protein
MISVKHLRLYDPAAMKLVKETFHEVWDLFEGQDVLLIKDHSGMLKGAVIRKLLDLVLSGVTDKRTLKAEALKQWPVN